MKTIETIEEAVEFYLQLLTENAQPAPFVSYGRTFEPSPYVYSAEWGNKFVRIVQNTENLQLAHAWVEIETGNVIKSASWKSPQKGKNGLATRYNLFDEESVSKLSEEVDAHGMYLYSK